MGDCRPRNVAQSRSLFVPYAADRDGVSAIGVCLLSYLGSNSRSNWS